MGRIFAIPFKNNFFANRFFLYYVYRFFEMDSLACEYDLATGLELRKTYADGKGTMKTYDAYNNLATVTDARGVVATYTCNLNRGLLTGINFSDDKTPILLQTLNWGFGTL